MESLQASVHKRPFNPENKHIYVFEWAQTQDSRVFPAEDYMHYIALSLWLTFYVNTPPEMMLEQRNSTLAL